MNSQPDNCYNSSENNLQLDEIDIEFEKVINQLEFIAWIKTLDELVKIDEMAKKIEINYLVNYHKQ